MNPKTFRNAIAAQCGMTNKAKPYAIQVCNAGAMPDQLPTSFEDWLKANGDAIDIGGNWTPSKYNANLDRYGNDNDRPF